MGSPFCRVSARVCQAAPTQCVQRSRLVPSSNRPGSFLPLPLCWCSRVSPPSARRWREEERAQSAHRSAIRAVCQKRAWSVFPMGHRHLRDGIAHRSWRRYEHALVCTSWQAERSKKQKLVGGQVSRASAGAIRGSSHSALGKRVQYVQLDRAVRTGWLPRRPCSSSCCSLRLVLPALLHNTT